MLNYLPKKSMWFLIAMAAVLALGLMVALSGVAQGAHSTAVSKVYWTDRNNATVSATDIHGGNITTQLVAPTGGRLQDIDLDTNSGVLYFADWGPVGFPGGQGSINQVNTDGTGLAPVFNTGDAVHQLALDQANQTIYFTRAVSYDNHEISVVDYNGANYTTFLSGDFGGPGWFPSGLALDSANSLLYWGDIGVINNPPNGSVNSMTTAGAAQTQLTPHVNGRGRGFALDAASQMIYLTSHDPGRPGANGSVHTYDIANNVLTQIIPAVGSDPDTGYWDIEIDPVGQRIWYTAPGAGEIRSANFDGSNVVVELSNLTNPYGLALELDLEIEVPLDVHPTSCPNPVNSKGKGVVPVAILGTAAFDVGDIDLSTITLEGVAPLRSSLSDVATPYTGGLSDPLDRNDCTTDGPDGLTDLTLKFNKGDLLDALGNPGKGAVIEVEIVALSLTGQPIVGSDVIWIR